MMVMETAYFFFEKLFPYYRWWKSGYGKYPIISVFFEIPGGAGVLKINRISSNEREMAVILAIADSQMETI